MIVNKKNVQHYIWGDSCDGWVLSPSSDLHVLLERMPACTKEARHFHSKARQFFFVIAGVLTMELEGEIYSVNSMSGIEVPPGSKHQARNDSNVDVHFLVISSPTSRGDRTDL